MITTLVGGKMLIMTLRNQAGPSKATDPTVHWTAPRPKLEKLLGRLRRLHPLTQAALAQMIQPLS